MPTTPLCRKALHALKLRHGRRAERQAACRPMRAQRPVGQGWRRVPDWRAVEHTETGRVSGFWRGRGRL